jgi:hypothetical protein
MKPRVTLRQAIEDPELLGSALAGPTWHAWRVILLAAMGEALTKDELKTFWARLHPRRKRPDHQHAAARAHGEFCIEPAVRLNGATPSFR